MIRFLSGLLLVLGLGAAVFGGLRVLSGEEAPAPPLTSSASAPESAPVEAVQTPSDTDEAPRPRAVDLDVPTGNLSTPANAPEPFFGGIEETAPAIVAASPAEQLDALVEEAPVAYEVPGSAVFGKSFEATFALDATGSQTATSVLPGRAGSTVLEGSAKIAERIKASLIGSAFEIELISADTQLLSRDAPNVWRWKVTPREAGPQSLIFELYALEGEDARPLRTYRDDVEVSISNVQRAITLANTANPVVVMLGGIGSALGGLLGLVRFFRGRG